MKVVLYLFAASGIIFGVVVFLAAPAVTQQIAGLLSLLVGTSSYGFAAIVDRLEEMARHD